MSMKDDTELQEDNIGEMPLLEIKIVEDLANIDHEKSEANGPFRKTTYWNQQKSGWNEQNNEQLLKMNKHLEKVEEQLIKMEAHLDKITLLLKK